MSVKKTAGQQPIAPPKVHTPAPAKKNEGVQQQAKAPQKSEPKAAKDGLETSSRETLVKAAADQKKAQKAAQGLVSQGLRPGQEITVEGQINTAPPGQQNPALPGRAGAAVDVSHARGLQFEGSVKLGQTQAEPGLKNYATLEVSGSGAFFAEVGGDSKNKKLPVSVGAAVATGVKVTYEAKVTAEQARNIQQGKLTLPNPFDPTKMPEGTAAVLKGERFTSTQLEGAYKSLAAELGHTNASGVAMGVEKVSANQVRVTAGPYQAVENEAFIGLKGGQVAAGLGFVRGLEESKVKTVTIDVSKPEGRDAYFRLMTTGKFPNNDAAKGISQSGTIESVKYTGENTAKLQAGPLSSTFNLGGVEGELKRTNFADGTAEVEGTVRYQDGKAVVISRNLDKNGKEDAAATNVKLLAGRRSGESAANFYAAFSKDWDTKKFQEIAKGPPRDVQVQINNEQAKKISGLARQYIHNLNDGKRSFEAFPQGTLKMLAQADTAEEMAKVFARQDAGEVARELVTIRRHFHEQKPLAGWMTMQKSP
jgi:hypothetical protein